MLGHSLNCYISYWNFKGSMNLSPAWLAQAFFYQAGLVACNSHVQLIAMNPIIRLSCWLFCCVCTKASHKPKRWWRRSSFSVALWPDDSRRYDKSSKKEVSEYNFNHAGIATLWLEFNNNTLQYQTTSTLKEPKWKRAFLEGGFWNPFSQREAQSAAWAPQTAGLSGNFVHQHLQNVAASTMRQLSIHNFSKSC